MRMVATLPPQACIVLRSEQSVLHVVADAHVVDVTVRSNHVNVLSAGKPTMRDSAHLQVDPMA